MRRKALGVLGAFIAVLILHALYSIWRAERISDKWLQIEDVHWLNGYIERGDYMIGLSYALAAGFTVYALIRFFELRRRSAIGGVLGGVTFTGIIYVGGCFLLGCCGSPMAAVYAGVFGSSYLGFAKPLVLAVTAVSVLLGYVWLERKSGTSSRCCSQGDSCQEVVSHGASSGN